MTFSEEAGEIQLPERSRTKSGTNDPKPFPIVGIGASAGGLEACTEFLRAMPADTGIAVVIIQHLAPDTTSMMSDILGRVTTMPVKEIEGGERVQPNHVYVIAPAKTLTVDQGILRLHEPDQPRGQRHPVDLFFRSLARDQEDWCAGIILSGTGSNGSVGIRDIKDHGGVVLVQDPDTAKFDGMPRHAIATDIPDEVISPAEMPELLTAYFARVPVLDLEEKTEEEKELAELHDLLRFVRDRTGRDFQAYKKNTLFRRVYRRMGLKSIDGISNYTAALGDDPSELRALVTDLLISVTAFFRDDEAWEALQKDVIRPMVAAHDPVKPIRVWVPACSTGEEAYSLAMLISEELHIAKKQTDVKIFSTDLSGTNLGTAREGLFPDSIAADVSKERLERHFDKVDGFYRLKKPLREMVVFAEHNLLTDPPFSRVDLVSCRNLMIYFEPEAQKRIIRLLHFSLVDNGALFLGNAETIGRDEDLWEVVSKKWRIYRRIGPTRYDRLHLELRGREGRFTPRSTELGMDQKRTLSETVDRLLAERYAPASVVIDRKGDALYFHGRTEEYLSQPQGAATDDILALAREGLRGKLHAAIRRAAESNTTSVVTGGYTIVEDTHRIVRIIVDPIPAATNQFGHLLVSFEREPAALTSPSLDRSAAETWAFDAERTMQAELRGMRDELQSTIEQLESSNEELKASNEEVTSINEELQSTNEELETSKEELQSLNEELNTVNHQLESKVDELERRTNDLTNLLAGTDIATLFLDLNLRIQWFSPAVERLVEILPMDIGRPISSFAFKFEDERFTEDCTAVLSKLAPIETEVQNQDGQWFIRRILPYRTQDNRISGVVVTFVEITERKGMEQQLLREQSFTQSMVDSIHEPLVVLDDKLNVYSANAAFYEMYGLVRDDIADKRFDRIGGGEFDFPELHKALKKAHAHRIPSTGLEMEHDFARVGRRNVLVDARPIDGFDYFLLSVRDVTDVKQRERTATERHERKRLAGELHDYLAQQLVVSQMQLKKLKHRLGGTESSASVDEVLATIDDSLHYTRTLIADLSPPVLYESGIVPAARWLADRMSQHNLAVDVSEKGEPHEIQTNTALQLYQILRELLFNVLKHAQTDTAHCRLQWTQDSVMFEISDHGIGFDPANRSASEDREGHFGLDSIEERVGELGGSFEVIASPGSGCTVRVRIPYQTKPSKSGIRKIRTLLVDDHQLVRTGIRNLLETRDDIEIVGEAPDGPEAIEAVESLRPDIVIMDWNMPNMSGKEATSRIRNKYPDTIIIGCTVHDDKETHRAFLAAGAQAVLSKDRLADDLFSTIERSWVRVSRDNNDVSVVDSANSRP